MRPPRSLPFFSDAAAFWVAALHFLPSSVGEGNATPMQRHESDGDLAFLV